MLLYVDMSAENESFVGPNPEGSTHFCLTYRHLSALVLGYLPDSSWPSPPTPRQSSHSPHSPQPSQNSPPCDLAGVPLAPSPPTPALTPAEWGRPPPHPVARELGARLPNGAGVGPEPPSGRPDPRPAREEGIQVL